MLHLIKFRFRRLLGHVESRFVRSRPGSVLILVVALLVLMAMIGTAYLVTARNDRVSARLYEHNVQGDILLDGLMNLVNQAINDAPTASSSAASAQTCPSFQLAPKPAPMAVPHWPNLPGWGYASQDSSAAPILFQAPNWQPGFYAHTDDFTTTGTSAGTAIATSDIVVGSFYTTTTTPTLNPLGPTSPQFIQLYGGAGTNKTWLASRYPVDMTALESKTLPAAQTYANGNFVNPLSSVPYLFNTTAPGTTAAAMAAWGNWRGMPFPKGAIINSGANYVNTVDNNPLPPFNSNNAPANSGGTPNPGWIKANLPSVCAWPAVSDALGGGVFEDPRYSYVLDASDPRNGAFAAPSGTVGVRPDGARTFVQPTYIRLSDGVNYPALSYNSYVHGTATSAASETALAASASGNGIADAFLWRLPVGKMDGITWYAAVRIIDNNSAINVNTANAWTTEFYGDGSDALQSTKSDVGFGPGVFPSGIGLAELLNSFGAGGTIPSPPYPMSLTSFYGQEFVNFNQYRANNGNALGIPSGVYAPGGTSGTPFDDTPQARNDYVYRSMGDALWHGMGRRPMWPAFAGVAGSGSPPPPAPQFQAFSWDDAATLAYKFDLVNANATPTTLEQTLYSSLVAPPNTAAFPSTPWDPSQTNTWFASTFTSNFSGVGGLNQSIGNKRPYLTAHNPTSNLMPAHNMYNLLWPNEFNGFNHTVPAGANAYATVYTPPSIATLAGTAPMTAMSTAFSTTAQQFATWSFARQNADIQTLMGGNNYVTAINPNTNDASAPVNLNPPTPRVSLNTADITGADAVGAPVVGATAFPLTNNLNIAATTPVKGPSLWLGFYNAMIDAIAPNYNHNISSANSTPQTPGYLYIAGSPQHFLPSLGSQVGVPASYPRLGQFRSPLRDVNGAPYTITMTNATPTITYSNPNAPNYMDANQVVLLRSLIAAVNAKDLRDSDDAATHVQAAIQAGPPSAYGNVPVPNRPVLAGFIQNTYSPIDVHVYGTEKQPFITEVYVNNEIAAPATIAGGANGATRPNTGNIGKKNPKGYVAVELYNPYDVPIDMSYWTLGIMNRSSANYPNAMTIKSIAGFGSFPLNTVIQPKSFKVLENYGGGNAGTDATYRPFASYPGAPATTATTIGAATCVYVQNLHAVLTVNGSEQTTGGELILLRQLPANGANAVANPGANVLPQVTPPTAASTTFSYATLTQYAPVDAFDFAGMTLPQPPVAGTATQSVCSAFHYSRLVSQAVGQSWRFVYPGRWDANKYFVSVPPVVTSVQAPGQPIISNPPPAVFGNFPFQLRQEGVAISVWNPNLPAGSPNANDIWNYQQPGSTATINGVVTSQKFNAANPEPPGSAASANVANYLHYYAAPITFNFNTASTYINNFPAIQLNNTDFGGPSKINTYNSPSGGRGATGTSLMFPFGGFARVGDVLQVPYIGSYMILVPPAIASSPSLPNPTDAARIIEINPVTTDSSFADDNDTDQVIGYTAGNDLTAPSDDAIEQVGRFCPLSAADPTNATLKFYPADATKLPMADTYSWASHIFDYFTVLGNPHDDYSPNVDPNAYATGMYDAVTGQYRYITGDQLTKGVGVPQSKTALLSNGAGGTRTNGGSEDMTGVEGQININTATASVLAKVPWTIITTQNGNLGWTMVNQTNIAVANSIVQYRNTYGPFKTLFDLNKVLIQPSPGNQTWFQQAPPFSSGSSGDPANYQFLAQNGNISPYPHPGATTGTVSPPDNVVNDFENRFGNIIRLSNILTTRSDTFTAYVLVQGWSGAGTGSPSLVVQRRAAMLIDRTTLNGYQNNPGLNVTTVPTN